MIPSVFTEKCDVKIQFFRIIGWHIQQEWDKIQAIAKNQSVSACKFGGSVLAPLCSDDPI